jgi:hypothetical protein
MNNFMYTVMNAVIPMKYVRASVHIHVKWVTRHSVNGAI